jgi:sporulation protein YabP
MQQSQAKTHGIIVENRKKIVLSGVKEVERFDAGDIIVITHCGGLRIRGRNFEVGKINTESGDMEISGTVTSIHYCDTERSPNNIITKLFR